MVYDYQNFVRSLVLDFWNPMPVYPMSINTRRF